MGDADDRTRNCGTWPESLESIRKSSMISAAGRMSSEEVRVICVEPFNQSDARGSSEAVSGWC